MVHTIRIISLYEAELLNTSEIEKDYIMISIVSSTQSYPQLNNSKQIGLLQLKIDDVIPEAVKSCSTCKLMTEEQARYILNFINEYKDKVNTIYVHCELGIARSPAIGCIISRYLNGEDLSLFSLGEFIPNKFIYKIMCKVFGLDFKEMDFAYKLKISQEKLDERLKNGEPLGICINGILV